MFNMGEYMKKGMKTLIVTGLASISLMACAEGSKRDRAGKSMLHGVETAAEKTHKGVVIAVDKTSEAMEKVGSGLKKGEEKAVDGLDKFGNALDHSFDKLGEKIAQ